MKVGKRRSKLTLQEPRVQVSVAFWSKEAGFQSSVSHNRSTSVMDNRATLEFNAARELDLVNEVFKPNKIKQGKRKWRMDQSL